MTLFCYKPSCFSYVNDRFHLSPFPQKRLILRLHVHRLVSMRIPRFAHENKKVCNKTRSPPASLLFKGQGTEHTTVKWSVEFWTLYLTKFLWSMSVYIRVLECIMSNCVQLIFKEVTSLHQLHYNFVYLGVGTVSCRLLLTIGPTFSSFNAYVYKNHQKIAMVSVPCWNLFDIFLQP